MKKSATSRLPKVPAELSAALSKIPFAEGIFGAMAPSHRREYIKHIMEAKQPQTRVRRAQKAVERIVERGVTT